MIMTYLYAASFIFIGDQIRDNIQRLLVFSLSRSLCVSEIIITLALIVILDVIFAVFDDPLCFMNFIYYHMILRVFRVSISNYKTESAIIYFKPSNVTRQ